jgi:hypothetical protein
MVMNEPLRAGLGNKLKGAIASNCSTELNKLDAAGVVKPTSKIWRF